MSLSSAELAQLRADANSYLPDTCTVQTCTRASDSQGGWTETWANTYTSVACRIAPETGSLPEVLDNSQLRNLSYWVLTLHHDQTINEECRVVHSSITYEVTRVEDTHSWHTAKRAHLRRVD